ncbi:MAG: hypothetical protein V1745_02390 [Patescibacteria group bacterium]
MNRLLIACLTLTLFGFGCAKSAPSVVEAPAVETGTSTFVATPGQRFGEMYFIGVDASNVATFAGTTQVSGTYATSELDGNICLYPDTGSSERIPDLRTRTDDSTETDTNQFCFSNKAVASELLGQDGGSATVIIKGFSGMVVDSSQPPTSELVSVVSVTPTILPTSIDFVITPELKAAFEKDFASETDLRTSNGLPPGHYFTSIIADASYIIRRDGPGTYEILGLGGVQTIDGLPILEPKGQGLLYLYVEPWKDYGYWQVFDLKERRILNSDSPLRIVYWNAISPTEDQLIYIGDEADKKCPAENQHWSNCAVDYGRYLIVKDLTYSDSEKDRMVDPFDGTIFARLPAGYSYAKTVYPPNLMGEGLRSAGDVTWTDKGIRAKIYSDATPVEYPGPERTALRSITVRLDQATVDIK